MASLFSHPILILIAAQLLFTLSDLIGRYEMTRPGFFLSNVLKPWIIFYIAIRLIASLGQLIIFTRFELGKTMAFFGATSIALSTILGLLFLNESLSLPMYLGVAMAIGAFLILAFL